MTCKSMILITVAAFGLGAGDIENRVTAKVPFAFDCAGKMMAAGEYSFTRVALHGRVFVRNIDTGAVAITNFVPLEEKKATAASIAFQKVRDHYYLDAVNDPTRGIAYIIPPTRKLKETAKVETPERILIAAR